MKLRTTLSAILICTVLLSPAQDAINILKKSYAKCQTAQGGYYEFTTYNKYMTAKDTSKNSYTCYFKKLKDDSIFSSAFHYYFIFEGKPITGALYTGNELVSATNTDSTATIFEKGKDGAYMQRIKHNYGGRLYSPLTNRKSYPMPDSSDFVNPKITITTIGNEVINSDACYHFLLNQIPENGPGMNCTRQQYHYWIRKSDFIPLQYTEEFDFVMGKDTMAQYTRCSLTKYEPGKPTEKELSMQSIPAYYKLQNFVETKAPEVLANGTPAPDWNLTSLKDEKISLSSLKGKVVLIDFFYKACYPCMQALPHIQALHKKYKDKGLVVLGIDPYDTKEDEMERFLAKRDVNYTVLYADKELPKKYNVRGYPTVYLIGKDGTIIFSSTGFAEKTGEALEEIIEKHL